MTTARERIEADLLARKADDAWQAPEHDVALLRSELAACRDEIDRLRGVIADVSDRCIQWIADNPPSATFTMDLLGELLADIEAGS